MKFKDDRIKLMNDVLNGIKVIKYVACFKQNKGNKICNIF